MSCTVAKQVTFARAVCARPTLPVRSARSVRVKAAEDDKKKITREAEPEEYWGSKYEKPGANPMKDPLAIIGVFAILFPFLLLGVFIGTGVIDLTN